MTPTGAAPADQILLGNVVTLDHAGTVARAIAIAGDRILAVGSEESVLGMRGPATVVHDFRGATIIPGFNDTHAHLDGTGMRGARPSLAGARSIGDVLERVAQLARQTPPGEWIVTMPIGEPPFYFDGPGTLAEKRMPTRAELDRAAPEHPVYICSPNGYWGQPPCYSAMNSLGLKLNGIGRDTRPRAGNIEILHDATGEPSGVFVEHNFVNMLERDLLPAVPRFSYAQRRDGIKRAVAQYHAKGTTSIYEGHGSSADILAAYRELHERGELTMRVGLVVSPAWSGVDDAERLMRDWLPLARGRGFGDDMLRVSGIFINYGGDPWIPEIARKNYSDVAWSGLVPQAHTPEEFEALCRLAARHDLRVHTVVSDKLHEIVPIMERIAAEHPIGERRWVLEHVSRARDDDLRRVQRLGVAVTLIPPHYVWKVGQRFFQLPPEELALLSPARRLFELGVPVAAGTDAVPYDPLFCLWVMTTRRERTTGRVMGEAGVMPNEAALRLLTVGGAWLTFDEHRKGPLAPGYLADLAVLSGDPLATVGDGLLELECRATMVGGRWVYRER